MSRISLLCPDLGRGPLYTAWMFGGAMSADHDVELIGPETARLWPPAEGEIVPAHTLSGGNPLRAEVRREALKAVASADLLYAFKPHPASFGLGLSLRRHRHVPLAVHLDDWDSAYFADRPLGRRVWYAARAIGTPENELVLKFLEGAVSRADLVTVSTSALQRRFGGTVVRQGVDGSRFSPDRFPRDEARARIGVAADVPLVLFVGTPSVHKGLGDLIAAFRALPDDLRGKLIIVGTPPDAGSARELEDAAGQGVECRPSAPFGEVAWYIAAADVACAPQRSTPFAEHQLPAKLLHWMTQGACVLTTDVGDANELLGGAHPAGRVVPAGDRSALSDALAALLGDETQRRRLGSEARARAEEHYTWAAMSRELDRLFDSVGLER
jgi:glycosyltransferase involved in cell wall biosynthesis